MASSDRYPFASVLAWSAWLLVALVLFCLPLTALLRWSISGAIVIATVVAIAVRTKWSANSAYALPDSVEQALSALPVGLRKEAPLVMWCPVDGTQTSACPAIYDDNAIWMTVARPEHLPVVVAGVNRWRDRRPDAVVLAIAPGQSADETRLLAEVVSWRQVLHSASQRSQGTMPVWLALYAPRPFQDGSTSADLLWRGVVGGPSALPGDADALMDMLTAQLDVTAQPRSGTGSALDDVRMYSVVQWARTKLSPVLKYRGDGLPPTRLQGVLVCGHEASIARSALSHWVTQRCAVDLDLSGASQAELALPLSMVPLIQRPRYLPAIVRALLHIVTVTALAVAAAMYISAMNNGRLVRQIHDDLTNFQTISDTEAAARQGALAQLKLDRDTLQRYRREGVPWRLGWWMYRGEMLLPALDEAIAEYRPPAPPPSMITLDSLSLFASNSAQLRPDANRALVGALITITQNPEKRVLIAGHTDNTGSALANQKLSEARAAAVRDWFVAMSKVPASHFAIQGYGDTRPLVANDTPENKARNRRVEITLVPDLPAH